MGSYQHKTKENVAQTTQQHAPRAVVPQLPQVQPQPVEVKSNEEGLAEHAERLRKFQRLGNSMIQMGPTRPCNDKASSLQPQPWIQRKLTIGEPGDKYEHEADRVESQVVQQINAPAFYQSNVVQSVQLEKKLVREMQAQYHRSAIRHRQEIINGEVSMDLESAIKSTNGQVVQRGSKPTKESADNEDYNDGPTEAQKQEALRVAKEKLMQLAAIKAQKTEQYEDWSIDQILRDVDLTDLLKEAMETEDGDKIVETAKDKTWFYAFKDDIKGKILAAEVNVEAIPTRDPAGDRRLVVKQSIYESDLSNDKDHKKIINELADTLLRDNPAPIMQYNDVLIDQALTQALPHIWEIGGMLISGNAKPVESELKILVGIAKEKGYPVENVDFVKALARMALSLVLLGSSGSENADKEDAGGKKAKTRR